MRHRRKQHAWWWVLLVVLVPGSAAQEVTDPAAWLGRPLGADFELADWSEVSGYYRLLDQQSPRVQVQAVGTTTEGREFLLAVISSEDNLSRLPEIQAAARRVADPRGLDGFEREQLLADARPILFISLAMHSTETAAPQFGMELAHRLATLDAEPYRSARERLVVLIAPCLNPDGLDHVVDWYRRTVGTPYEAADLLRLYQYYAGHDNNRDWFMLSQNETRITTKLLYSQWFPQVYWDVHQQGSSRERFFVPPFRDPLNPNLDPGVIAGIGQLGARALFDMTREGLTGVSTGVTYDMWWNGGNRNVPVRHNILGLLTEAASVKLASPVFLPRSELQGPRGLGDYAPSNRFPAPWPGGWWHLRNIIDYEHVFARSLLSSLAREPRLWVENALLAAERAIARGREDAPRAWILPSSNRDRGAARRLVDTLLLGGVEVHVADEAFEADGRAWPAGSLVVRRDQPYGQHVKDLMEVQRYPQGAPPYDVAGWTLPLLMGVRRVELMGPVPEGLRRVTEAEAAVAAFGAATGDGLADSRDSDAWVEAFARLRRGEPVALASGGDDAGRLRFSRPSVSEKGWTSWSEPPRVGLYAPWSGSMDEGWARWVLDSFGVPFVRVRNEMVRAGDLGSFLDVLLVASIPPSALDEGRAPGTVPPEYARGLGPEGAAAVDDFVRQGGTLLAVGRSAQWAIDLFDLPLEDVTRGPEAGDFSCPGSVLRAVPESSRFTAGLPDSLALFFSRSAAWKLLPRDAEEKRERGRADADEPQLEVLLRYAPTRVLLSGWIRSPDVIAGHAAWVRAGHGHGQVHLFGFRPQYRGWSQGTFSLLFRALLLDG